MDISISSPADTIGYGLRIKVSLQMQAVASFLKKLETVDESGETFESAFGASKEGILGYPWIFF
jgi:hypothetical protein